MDHADAWGNGATATALAITPSANCPYGIASKAPGTPLTLAADSNHAYWTRRVEVAGNSI